jgi:uncharacterized protein YraI
MLVALLAVQPAAAQNSYATWTARYFNNEQLIDPPIFQTTVNEVNFDWGSNSPDSSVNNNNFSARFGTDTYFKAGTYRFTITADDSFQLWVDYNLKITTYNSPKPGETQTVDVTLTEGVHHLQVDYREITGNAYLKLAWVNLAEIPAQPINGSWTGQYYSNATLSGTPFTTVTEANPSHEWGIGAPFAGMPADNFSVRWTTTQNLAAGNYGIQVRADDGVRVFVNGVAYVNQWQLANGQTYSVNFNLAGGVSTIVVEYFESGFNAFIDFKWFSPQQQQPGSPTGAAATVTAATLNVRSAPTTSAAILTKIRNGETYAITGRNQTSTWWQLNVNGVTGWVSALFVNAVNTANVPVVDPGNTQPPVQPTQFTVTTVSNLHLRSQPTTASDSLLVIPRGSTAQVVARNSSNTWLRVTYSGVTGWVSISFVAASPPLNLDQIPVQ